MAITCSLTLKEILSTDSWSSGRVKINDNFAKLKSEVCEIIETLQLDTETGSITLSGDICADQISANIITLANCDSPFQTIVLDGVTGVITASLVNADRLEAEQTLRLGINPSPGSPVEGMIRWSGVDLFLYDGTDWISLTGGTTSNIWSVNGTTLDIYFDPVGSPTGRGVAIGRTTADASFHLEGDLILDIPQSPAIAAGYVLTATDSIGTAEWKPSPIGSLGGSGTIDRHAKFTAITTLGDGLIGDDGTTLTFYGSVIPDVSATYNLGSSTKRFKDIFLGSTIDYASSLIFKEAGTERARFSGAFFGLGIAAPAYTLDVSGTLRLGITGSGSANYVLTNTGSGVAEWKSLSSIGGISTINTIAPVAGDFTLIAGSAIDLTPGVGSLTIAVDATAIDHEDLLNIGTNSHADIDSHIADSSIHYPQSAIDHLLIGNVGVNTHAQIDTHIADSTIHFTEASIDHTAISNIGVNTHAQIDTHIANTSNPHLTTLEQARAVNNALSGHVSLSGLYRVINAADPVNPQDYATKFYVDSLVAGGSLSHFDLDPLSIGSNTHDDIDAHIASTANPHATTLEQARSAGSTVLGNINLGGNKITNSALPTANGDLANKQYVDSVSNGKVKVTSADTTADFLQQSLSAGPGITFTLLNPGGNEILRISAEEFTNQFAFNKIYDLDGGIAEADAQTDGLLMYSNHPALTVSALNDFETSPDFPNADTVFFDFDPSLIDHDSLGGVNIDQHRAMNDGIISNITLWSSQQIVDYFNTIGGAGFGSISDGINSASADLAGDTFSLIAGDPFINIVVGDDQSSPVGSPALLFGDHAMFRINVDDSITTFSNLWSAAYISSLLGTPPTPTNIPVSATLNSPAPAGSPPADEYTGTSGSPGIGVYDTSVIYLVTFDANNVDGDVRLDIDGAGLLNVLKGDETGLVPLDPNDIVASVVYYLVYDGTQLQFFESAPAPSPGTYTNLNPSTVAVGGIAAGTVFNNMSYTTLFDTMFYPALLPSFSSFSISGQTISLEVGNSVTAGSKTFIWNTTNPIFVQPNTIRIRDLTGATWLTPLMANDSSEVVVFGSPITKTTNTSHTWRIYGVRTNGSSFLRDFTVSWFWRRFFGTSASTSLTEAGIEALISQGLASGISTTYSFAAGDYKYFAFPTAFAAASFFRDTATNLAVAMAGPTEGFTSTTGNGYYFQLVSVTNTFGVTHTYRVYRTRNVLGGSINISVT